MKLSSLPKVTKLISGRTRLQTQGACLNSKHFRIVQTAWFNLPAALEETDLRNGRTRTSTNCPTKTIQILAKQLKPTISKLGKLAKATEKN